MLRKKHEEDKTLLVQKRRADRYNGAIDSETYGNPFLHIVNGMLREPSIDANQPTVDRYSERIGLRTDQTKYEYIYTVQAY